MNFSAFSPAALATSIWANSTRTLTGLGAALSLAASVNQSLAASTSFQFSATSGTCRFISLGMASGAAGTLVASIFDGTRNYTVLSVVAGSSGALQDFLIVPSVNLQLTNNDAANAAAYCVSQAIFSA